MTEIPPDGALNESVEDVEDLEQTDDTDLVDMDPEDYRNREAAPDPDDLPPARSGPAPLEPD